MRGAARSTVSHQDRPFIAMVRTSSAVFRDIGSVVYNQE